MNSEVQEIRQAHPGERAFIIAFGGNMFSENESRAEFAGRVVASLTEKVGKLQGVSRLYSTPAFPPGSGDAYVNGALHLIASQKPDSILTYLHEIECEFGRQRIRRWGPRRLDLDLVAAGQEVLPDLETHRHWRELPLERQMQETPGELILPHPRLQDRAFVLVPMRDVAPEWRHPILGRTVTEMCDALPPEALAEVVPLAESACL